MIILGFIFLFLALHYFSFLIRVFSGLLKLSKDKNENSSLEFVSILIPFRNESAKILENIQSIQNQDFPEDRFEVIYLNDASEDDGPEKLKKAITKKNIKVVNIEQNGTLRGHKKEAIRQGLKIAKGDIIISTDSDCTHKPGWLKTMINCFDADTAFVSGPVEFKDSGTLFSKLQRLEFAGLIFTGAGLIGAKTPIICNAANLAYRKNVFDEVDGFGSQNNLSSGDDEIFMQKIARQGKYKIKFCPYSEANVITDPNTDLAQLMNQRKRWASKGFYYNDKILILRLVLLFLFYLGFIIQPVLGIFLSTFYFQTFIISVILKIIPEFLIIKKGSELLKISGILPLFLPAQILHIPYIIISAINGAIGNFEWRGRKLER